MSKHGSKDLKHDEFKETIENIIIYYEHHKKAVLWIVGGIAILLILLFTYSNNKKVRLVKAREVYNIGVIFYNNGNLPQAKEKFLTVTSNYSGTVFSDRATFMMANISYKEGNIEDAMNKFQTFTNVKYDEVFTPGAYQGIGQCHAQMGDLQKAIENYSIAVEKFKNGSSKSECMIALARLYFITRRFDQAEEIYKNVIEISGDPYIVEDAEKKLKSIQVLRELDE